MARWEKYGTRDLTFSEWHRRLEPGDSNFLTCIDIDVVEYCALCNDPLAFLELAWDVGQPHKAATVLRRVAALANRPAYVMLYRVGQRGGIVGFRLRQIYPTWSDWQILTPSEVAALIWRIHLEHRCPGSENQPRDDDVPF